VKVAIVIDSVFRGGAERQALYTARGLAGLGCDVELIYYARCEWEYDLGLAGEARVTYLPKEGRPLRFLRRLRRHLERGAFSVVHSYKNTPCLYGGIAAWRAGVPVILGGLRVEYDDRGLVRLGHRLVQRVQAGWVVNSEAVAASVVREIGADPDRCFVVRNAIDASQFRSSLTRAQAKAKLGLAPDAPTVSILAGFRPQKNHALFLDAAQRVLGTHPDARFLVIGDGPERSAIEVRIAALGLADRVLMLGFRSDVADCLAATDVSVLTSDYEGVSNSLMESMSAGVPVVSTRYPGADELVTDGQDGLLVPLGDARMLADRLCKLLGDPAQRERLGRGGQRTIEARYGIGVMASSLLALYEDRLRLATGGRAA
jgi:glycosyltransferase involved in cell wall biosynthesis